MCCCLHLVERRCQMYSEAVHITNPALLLLCIWNHFCTEVLLNSKLALFWLRNSVASTANQIINETDISEAELIVTAPDASSTGQTWQRDLLFATPELLSYEVRPILLKKKKSLDVTWS